MKLWDSFDLNEWLILGMLIGMWTIFFILPKRLPRYITMLSLVWGSVSGMLFDIIIGTGLIDFYSLNDNNHYEIFDFLYFLNLAPSGYFFIYFYDFFKIKKQKFIWYVLIWGAIGYGTSWLLTKVHIIEFQNGYKLSYSVVFFIVTQTITGLYYRYIKKRMNYEKPVSS
ncbi:hypothetical protein [Niallia sp. NCCP-28]|uniref:hypothetical protein n=1 Tax=Niallia sp. NCCP-28 TaxID=2934712 RepID=UPI0020843440|nr:hypothetical protein [Niallia sp. NCCP-28]GKU83530.1 hypothetical protein NCCP28_29260 [Niallia sp. NCCP-28]